MKNITLVRINSLSRSAYAIVPMMLILTLSASVLADNAACYQLSACRLAATFNLQEGKFVLSDQTLTVIPGDKIQIRVANLSSTPIVEYTCKWDEKEGGFLGLFEKTVHKTKPVPVHAKSLVFGVADPKSFSLYQQQRLGSLADGQRGDYVVVRPGRITVVDKSDVRLSSPPHPNADCKPGYKDATASVTISITRAKQ